MSGEKKNHWRLPMHLRRLSGKQDLRPKSQVSDSKRRLSSVYLSHDTSTSGFIVVPEFDDPAGAVTTRTSNHATHSLKPPVLTSTNLLAPNDTESHVYDLEPIDYDCDSHTGKHPLDSSAVNTSWDDDLSQRLGSAYEHIRSMPSVTSPNVSLSSDPQMLRKQLGVPQHSVLNYPIHSVPSLPNPHNFPRMSTPPQLSPPPWMEVSHARTSKTLGLCIDANLYPTSPRHDYSDRVRPAHERSVVSVQAPTQKFSLQRRTPEASRSTHTPCTRWSQSSISTSLKLVKRRVEKSAITSSPRRRVLRKSVSGDLSSANAPEWQLSLPQIRSPSPLKVDIPLHHEWHNRRTNFGSPELHFNNMVQYHDTKSPRTSENTEVLASLAWIGTSAMLSDPYGSSQMRCVSNPVPDRFSTAMAVEDDSISDDALVGHLEEVRKTGDPSECDREISPSNSLSNTHFLDVSEDENEPLHLSSLAPTSDQLSKYRGVSIRSPPITQDTTSDSEDAEIWRVARKALLCIREIVRTEKKYQESLQMLLNSQTVTPPPPSMVPYISALVRASETLLKYFLEDPSAWGVSTAFVTSEDELEVTMVSWCAVAGVFFMDENDSKSSGLMGKWRLRKPGAISSSSSTKQTSTSPSPQLPPILPSVSITRKIKERVDDEYCMRQCSQTQQERQPTPVSLHKPEGRNSRRPPSRKISVRDLAIQPIQRVMRYVLLYKDLLNCTPPPSPSRLLVERALEAAMRIANHCDRAQRNPAFFHPS